MNAQTLSLDRFRRRRTLQTGVLLFLFLLIVGAAAEAQRGRRVRAGEGRWTLLGTKKVTDRVETDVIRVNARRTDFTKLKIRAQDKGVEFRRVVVHFRNGKKQEIELRRVIPAGGESRVIDLVGGDRRIEKIVMTYDAQSLGGRQALIKVLARR